MDERDFRYMSSKLSSIQGWVVFLGICQIIGLGFWLLVIAVALMAA